MKKPKTNAEIVADQMMGKTEEPENKPTITLNSTEVNGLEGINVDDEGSITLKYRCIGKNKVKSIPESMGMDEGKKPTEESKPEEKGYDMVFEILGTDVADEEKTEE